VLASNEELDRAAGLVYRHLGDLDRRTDLGAGPFEPDW
jgi:hypothetical protein